MLDCHCVHGNTQRSSFCIQPWDKPDYDSVSSEIIITSSWQQCRCLCQRDTYSENQMYFHFWVPSSSVTFNYFDTHKCKYYEVAFCCFLLYAYASNLFLLWRWLFKPKTTIATFCQSWACKWWEVLNTQGVAASCHPASSSRNGEIVARHFLVTKQVPSPKTVQELDIHKYTPSNPKALLSVSQMKTHP